MNTWRLLRPTDVLLFVVLAGLVGVIGTIVFRRQLFASRLVTVQNEVGSLGGHVYGAFETSKQNFGNGPTHALCRSARPVPQDVAEIRGKSYAHRPEDWTTPGTNERDEDNNLVVGFPCLYYTGPTSKLLCCQINYTSDSSPTSPGTAFEVNARGDIDGDGDLLRIAQTGTIRDGHVLSRVDFEVENPEE